MATEYSRRRFTVDEYHRMGDAGILHEDDRVELIDGEIVEMTPINVPHAVVVGQLTMLLAPMVAGRAIVWVQNPIYIDNLNEPQPDIAVVKARNYLAQQHHPGPGDILLLIEVVDTSIATDRRHKIPRYARAGINEVWLVNIPKKVVEVYSEPVGGKYGSIQRVGKGQTIGPKALPDIGIAVDDFLA